MFFGYAFQRLTCLLIWELHSTLEVAPLMHWIILGRGVHFNTNNNRIVKETFTNELSHGDLGCKAGRVACC